MVTRLVGAELTQKGIFTVREENDSYIEEFFKDSESFIESLSWRDKVYLSIGRDVIYARKASIPKDAEEEIKKNMKYFFEELFPFNYDHFFTLLYKIKENESVELLIFAIPKEMLFPFLERKQIQVVTLTTFLYPFFLEKGKKIFIRKYYENICEKVLFKEDKIIDTFLEKPCFNNLDVQDPFYGAKLSLKAFKVNLLPSLVLKSPKIYSKKFKFTPFIFTVLSVISGYIAYEEYKKNINLEKYIANLHTQMDTLKPKIDLYSKLVQEKDKKERILNVLQNQKSYSLYYLNKLSEILPNDTWLILYDYDNKNRTIKIEGLTSSVVKLIRILEKSGYFAEINLYSTPYRENAKEHFILVLKVK